MALALVGIRIDAVRGPADFEVVGETADGLSVSALVERLKPEVLIVDVAMRSEEHTSELQSRLHLVCRLLLEKKKLARRFSPARLFRGTELDGCAAALVSGR